MNQFIIATHSTFAEGIFNALKFFKEDCENVQFINAYVEDQEFEKVFRKKMENIKNENVIILTDMMGGSVNQVVVNLSREYEYHVVTGINLPLILELVFTQNDITKEEIEVCVVNAKNQLRVVDQLVVEDESDEL